MVESDASCQQFSPLRMPCDWLTFTSSVESSGGSVFSSTIRSQDACRPAGVRGPPLRRNFLVSCLGGVSGGFEVCGFGRVGGGWGGGGL